MKEIACIILTFFAFQISAQLPATQLFHFKLTEVNGKYNLSKPRWLNQFNPKGYNNQPYFVNQDEVYISVQLPTDTTQTDIYSLNLVTKILTKITATAESEYSPKLIPGTSDFSVVRVDATKDKTQRLWQYPLNRSGGGKVIGENIEGVGYYHWINGEKALLFLVNNPQNELCLLSKTDNKIQKLRQVPGRCFSALNNGNIAFIEKTSEAETPILSLDPQTLKTRFIINTLPESEDFVVAENGTFFMGKNAYFYKFNPSTDKDWIQIANLREYGIKKIERLALNKLGDLIMVTK
ncbi:MAG: hypothetical protein ACOYOA_08015 [Saprospiraceae bacterium]